MTTNHRRLVLAGISLLLLALCAVVIIGLSLIPVNREEGVESMPLGTAVSATSPDSGVLIIHVNPDSPAESAGLAWGQFITAVNGIPVDNAATLSQRLQVAGPGSTVELSLLVNGAEQGLDVTLAVAPPLLGVQVVGRDGLTIPTPSPAATQAPERVPAVITGVMPGTPAESAGLLVDDVITAVNTSAILTADELVAAIQSQPPGTAVTLTFRRGPDTLTREITLAAHPDDPNRAYLGITLR